MIETALAVIFGLLFGSFLNVCVYRWPRGLSVVRPRSHCPGCDTLIAWYDNVPVLSFILLRGKCRHCGRTIPVRYVLVELAAGLWFGYAVWQFGLTLAALRLCVFGALLIGLTASDFEQKILPDAFTLPGIVAGLVLAVLSPTPPLLLYVSASPAVLSLLEALFGAAVPSFLIWVIGEAYYRLRGREGLGLGDVKMLAMIGAFMGLRGALLTLFLASFVGAVTGLVYVRIARKSAATYEIPFGVFLGIAGLALALAGNAFLAWYSDLGA